MISFKLDEGQLKDLLKKTDSSKTKKAIDIAFRRIGDAMELKAKTLAPWKMGNLRRSIKTQQSKDSVTTGTDVIYARIQEFGGAAGRGHKTIIKGKPYMTPALQEQKDGMAIQIITEEINKTL